MQRTSLSVYEVMDHGLEELLVETWRKDAFG